MGRELQKRKNRSSVSKVRQKPKSKKKIFNNPIIAANWDKKQTLTQNYQRLGLTVKLNNISGGTERKTSNLEHEEEDGADIGTKQDSLNIGKSRRRANLTIQEAKIERDPKTGNILRILDDSTPTQRANPLQDPLAELDSDSQSDDQQTTYQHGMTRPVGSDGRKTDVVRALEDDASQPAPKYKRRMPEGERTFIEELVRKYGDDVGKMARDMKINYMQRSEGDLRQRIKRWRQNGGTLD